jgi:hypothetical protein
VEDNTHWDRLFLSPFRDTSAEAFGALFTQVAVIEVCSLGGVSGLKALGADETERHVLELEFERKA